MADEQPTRLVTISAGFERKVSIGYQGWNFSVSFSEQVPVKTDDEVSLARKKMRIRAMGAVYVDILSDFGKLVTALEPKRIAGGQSLVAELQALKDEAEDGARDCRDQLAELGVNVAMVEKKK